MTSKKQYHYRLECGHRRTTFKLLHVGDIYGNTTRETEREVNNSIQQVPLYCLICDKHSLPTEVLATIGRWKL